MATKTTNSPLRAVIYTRISHDPTGKAEGVTRQEEACRKLAADLGWRVVAVKTDDDLTAIGKRGQRAKRPAFAALLDMLSAREADAVLVWHTDRLYRQARDLEPLIEIVDRTHAVIRPVQQGELDLATASGRMIARILASVSTHEVEHAIERMKAKHEANRRAGINHGGGRPFGYKAVKPKAKGETPDVPQVDPREAKLIREAANAVLAYAADPKTGMTLTGICKSWNARGIKSPRGKEWSIQSLRGALLSPRIAGRVAHKGEDVGPAQWDAIIDLDTWRSVKRVLTDTSRRSGSEVSREPKYLGSGLYRCGRDGCGAVVRPGGARAGQRQQYRCTASAHLIRTAEPIDDAVEIAIVAKLVHDAPIVAPKQAPAGLDVNELSTQRAALTMQLDSLAEEFADADEVETALYRARARKLREKITAVELEITDAQTWAAAASEPGPFDDIDRTALLWAYTEHPDVALTLWRETYSLARRRKMLDALAVVTLKPGRRGRPAGVAAGGLDPQSIDIDWKDWVK